VQYLIGFFVFAILVAIFALQNAGPVSIKLFFWSVPNIPLVLIILGTTLCGLVVGFLLGALPRRKVSSSGSLQESGGRSLLDKLKTKKVR
jgi:putative membrane protein